MGTTSNRKHTSGPLARTASLSMALLALSACSERQEKPPSSPGAATVFKDSPAPASPSPQAPTPTAQQQEGSEPPAADARSPEQLFSSLGCTACHGPGRAYSAVLARSRDKAPEVVAMWILDPQKVKPGTLMPSFTGRISTAEALVLAQWIKAGNPP
ncbi:MAG TPA: cytochrome c [Archangium sp.]|uniref:c-type cytochrome n=1 Tax=Archangium sp. TaxID=1872627 RepID=UPI002E34F924|nr:cytochrome c [Archangium sp.]HEX5753124.1 cytochrome c [Archangium sp.]